MAKLLFAPQYWVMVLMPAAWAQCELPASSPKVRDAQAVFEQLIRVADIPDRVELSVVETKCVARQNRYEGAWFDPAHHRVSLDVKLYDLCASPKFAPGNDRGCLAFLLGHELGHVSQTINRLSGFTASNSDSRPASVENAARESDADLRGGVYGYRAGYDALGHGAEILVAVYDTYGLSHALLGYPTLEERQAGVKSALAELRKLIPVFEAANLALIVGEYGIAADSFEAIARRFRSREVYNNKGLAYALWLACTTDRAQLPPYPWILDNSIRISATSNWSRGSIGTMTVEELFERAIRAFEEAKRLDSGYVPAYINAASLYDLYRPGDRHGLNELEDALDQLKEDRGLTPAVYLAKGIVNARRGKIAEASADFKQARDTGAAGAPALLKLLAEGKPLVIPINDNRELESREEERIGDRTAASLLKSRTVEEEMQLEANVPLRITWSAYGEEFWTVVVQRGGARWAFVITGAKYHGKTSRAIGAGATRAAMESSYCSPALIPTQACGAELRTATGTYVFLKKASTIFLFNSRDQVVSWAIYSKR